MLVWRRAKQERPHADLQAMKPYPNAHWRSGSGRRTHYHCAVCGAALVRSSLTRLEPGWRVGRLPGSAGLGTTLASASQC